MVRHDIRNFNTANARSHFQGETRDHVTFLEVWAFLKRNMLLMIAGVSIGAGLGIAYLINTPPSYWAVARLVMDPSQAKIASQDMASGTIIIESAEIASQVEIVKSEAVARSVIAELDLMNDPEIHDATSWRSAVKTWASNTLALAGLGKAEAPDALLTEEQRMRRTMAGFLKRVSARRVGQSYVLEVGYTSTNPNHAALVANTIARTYIRNGMNERSEAAKRGSAWLEERLIEIGKQAQQSQMAVEEYRANKGITPIGTSSTLDQQQLVETSSQLLQAQAATAAEKAKLDTISKLVAGAVTIAEGDESLNTSEARKLREEIRVAETKLATLRRRYAPANPAIASASEEVDRLKADLQNEYLRLERVMRSDLDVAREKERLIKSELELVKERGVASNLARVDLYELESRASTYRKMYEGVLQQLNTALQVQSFPLGTARITTAAATPLNKSSPKTILIMPLAVILGLSGGLMVAAWREGMNRSIGTGCRLQREIGIAALSSIPVHHVDRPFFSWLGKDDPKARMRKLRTIIDEPYCPFSETLRDLKTSIDIDIREGASLVIGIASAYPGEGKTTIATNLAQTYLNENIDTVIVDADFEAATLSKVARNHADHVALAMENLTSVTEGASPNNTASELAPARLPIVSTGDIICSESRHRTFGHLTALRSRLAELRERYRVVIVDMAGFASSADARAVCAMMDGIVIVVGNPKKMTVETFVHALNQFGPARINVLGAVFNRTASAAIRRRRARRHQW